MSIIWDLDGTLSDTRHRREAMPKNPLGPVDWIDYYADCMNDPPVPGRIALAQLMHAAGHRNLIVTARPATSAIMARTLAWLRWNMVPFAEIVLMPLDRHSVSEWKTEVIAFFHKTEPVQLVVDDWWKNGEALATMGIPFLHVTPPGVGRVGEVKL